MSELTNLELCKKIAEIELECDWVVGKNSIDLVTTNTYLGAHGMPLERVEVYGEYNPLDWSITGPLMVKHGVNIMIDANGFMVWADKEGEDNPDPIVHKDLQRAILLAIVAKHEGVK